MPAVGVYVPLLALAWPPLHVTAAVVLIVHTVGVALIHDVTPDPLAVSIWPEVPLVGGNVKAMFSCPAVVLVNTLHRLGTLLPTAAPFCAQLSCAACCAELFEKPLNTTLPSWSEFPELPLLLFLLRIIVGGAVSAVVLVI